MKRTILLSFTLISIFSFGQNLTCDDFIEGSFTGSSPDLPELEWKVIKTKNSQVEFLTKIPQVYKDAGIPMDSMFGKIKRIDKCSFNFLYDETKSKLDDSQKRMNDSGGLIVTVNKIEGKCFYYESQVMNNDLIIKGKMCKID